MALAVAAVVYVAAGGGAAGAGNTAGVMDVLFGWMKNAQEEDTVQITGSGAPSGPHYNLNLIGVPKNKTADLTSGSGHRIFVKLDGKSKIWLTEGDDFQVLDANGTDGNGASFQLPDPDPENDGVTVYSVYARALGKPGGSGTIVTCNTYLDPITGEELCSIETLELTRKKGKSSFTNVSKELLYIYADYDGDGDIDRLPLFDDRLEDYYWSYDNKGLKLVQLRFYGVVTDVESSI